MFGDFNVCHPADSLAIGAVVSNLRPADEVAANARLIAAAPELLEACQAAEKWLEGWASAEPYLSEIRAAIAKATQP